MSAWVTWLPSRSTQDLIPGATRLTPIPDSRHIVFCWQWNCPVAKDTEGVGPLKRLAGLDCRWYKIYWYIPFVDRATWMMSLTVCLTVASPTHRLKKWLKERVKIFLKLSTSLLTPARSSLLLLGDRHLGGWTRRGAVRSQRVNKQERPPHVDRETSHRHVSSLWPRKQHLNYIMTFYWPVSQREE